MVKADEYVTRSLKELLATECRDKNVRPKYKDGTEATTKFVTQRVFEYSISEGEFPITTLRNTALKGALGEILTIYRDQSNKQEDFLKNGVTWWGDWMNEHGNLGTAYAWNLEPYYDNREVVKVRRRTKTVTELDPLPPFDNVFSENNNSINNREVEGKYCNFRVLDQTSVKPNRFKVQLLDCGEIREVDYAQIRDKNVKSRYYKSIHNTGFYGNYSRFSWLGEGVLKELKGKWTQMFERCFSGNEKLSVWSPDMIDNRWHSFENFVQDCFHIPQFFTAKRDNFKGWVLDKDYYGANFYSKDTCVFVRIKDNKLNSEVGKVYTLGEVHYLSVKDLAEHLNMKSGRLFRILTKSNLNKENSNIRNSITIKLNNDSKFLYRFKLEGNQVNTLLSNMVKHPFSRRLYTSFFNFKEQHKKELVECAYNTMWSLRESNGGMKVDLTLTQRSQDYLMTMSINPAQYVMLGMMVCNHLTFHTGIEHKLGNFLHLVQNLHMYERHIPAAKEMLAREPIDVQPTIELTCGPKDFYAHTIDDFKFNLPGGIKKLESKLELAI